MAGCFGGSAIDRWMESRLMAHDEDHVKGCDFHEDAETPPRDYLGRFRVAQCLCDEIRNDHD